MSTQQPGSTDPSQDTRLGGQAEVGKLGVSALLGAWEFYLFAIICTADMVSTVYWFQHGRATEANPVLKFWLAKSVTAFCIAKLLSFMPVLIICAYYRDRYGAFITSALRIAMAAYVCIYAICIAAQLLRH